MTENIHWSLFASFIHLKYSVSCDCDKNDPDVFEFRFNFYFILKLSIPYIQCYMSLSIFTSLSLHISSCFDIYLVLVGLCSLIADIICWFTYFLKSDVSCWRLEDEFIVQGKTEVSFKTFVNIWLTLKLWSTCIFDLCLNFVCVMWHQAACQQTDKQILLQWSTSDCCHLVTQTFTSMTAELCDCYSHCPAAKINVHLQL